MNFFRQAPDSVLIMLITLFAFAFLGLAYVIADTGFPGGINPATGNLIYGGMAFILGIAGWVVVWRRGRWNADNTWATFWGYAIVALFWGTGIWFLFQWLR
ncbi:MAG TPA: hypothetical protein VI703_11920 [Anaerolineales bacterium]|jgi:hypothetical protein|nr:hypothetical protein [Anaerolineales bacterium]